MRKKAPLPDHLFAPKPIRIFAIVQLCIAFIVLGWYTIGPFLSDYFSTQSQILMIQTITGEREASGEQHEQLLRNKERFKQLPEERQNEILNDYIWLKGHNSHSFTRTANVVLGILLFKISPFVQAWIFFSIAVSILLLLKIEGATHAAWILPLILVIYAIYSLMQTTYQNHTSSESQLFPNEATIVQTYLKEPLNSKIMEQRSQLLIGWQRYLVNQWAHEAPSSNEEVYKQQVEKGEFAFAIARLKAQKQDYLSSRDSIKQKSPSYFLIAMGTLWSCFFAWGINRRRKRQ